MNDTTNNERILDINPTEKLTLVGDKDLANIKYRPYKETDVPEELAGVYLKQAHYCARVHTSGVTISYVEPLKYGWKKWDAAAQYWERR